MGKYFTTEQVGQFLKENNIQSGKDLQSAFKDLFKDFFQEAFEYEISEELGYSKHDWRNKKTTSNSRNGYTKKSVKTETAGEIDLKIPRDRDGLYEPKIVKKYEKDVSSIEDKIISMYAKGMSTKDINQHIEQIYGFEVSAEQVSRVTDKILPMVKEWQNRPLQSIYPVLFMDAMVFDIKEEGVYKKKTANIILGISLSGQKEILGLWIGDAESSKFWMNVLSEIKSRGVNDVFIFCVDGLKGFVESIKSIYPESDIQECIVHQIRNCSKYVPHSERKEFCADMKPIYKALNEESGLKALEEFEKKWGNKYPHAVQSWYNKWDRLSTFFKYPEDIRKIIYTTNPIESYNSGIKRITKTKLSFKTEDSLIKLIYLVTQELERKWVTQIRNWGLIFNQLMVYYKDRIPEDC